LSVVNQTFSIGPQYADALDIRGTIYYALNEYEKSIKDYQHCFELYEYDNPVLAYIHYHLGQALMKVGKESQAIKALNTALNKDRINPVFTEKDRVAINTLLGN